MCELCDPKHVTKWYDVPEPYDEEFCCFDCKTCGEPMIVARRHSPDWDAEDIKKVVQLGNKLFPGKRIRLERRRILDHPHCHLEWRLE